MLGVCIEHHKAIITLFDLQYFPSQATNNSHFLLNVGVTSLQGFDTNPFVVEVDPISIFLYVHISVITGA